MIRTDFRKLNEVCSCFGGVRVDEIHIKSGWSIVGYIGSGKDKERVYLEEDVKLGSVAKNLAFVQNH